MKRTFVGWAAVLGTILVAGSTSVGAEDITTVRVLHPVGVGFTIDTDVIGTTLKAWSTLNDGTVLMFKRDVTTTLPWSVQTYTVPGADVLDVVAGQATTPSGKTCCTMTCRSGYHFKVNDQDCIGPGFNCEVCSYTCSDGWVNCPIGTQELDKR